MRHPHGLSWLTLVIGLGVGSLPAATIKYDVSPLGGNSYQYNYVLSGITFQANDQLDIRFNPSLYGTLWNGLAPGGFEVILLQPNNPPGDFGDYSAMAQINNLFAGDSFSVRCVYLGEGDPGPQPFFINRFSAEGFYISTIEAGMTTNHTPEPSSLHLVGLVLLLTGLWQVRRRFRPRQARTAVGPGR